MRYYLQRRTKMTKEQLIAKAKEARELSYSPYSNFKVGAALLTKDGKVFLGANIENSAYSMCMCAERNAIYHAYMNGYKKEDIVALALCADTEEPCSPCGACRQVMADLMKLECKVTVANDECFEEFTVNELLPKSFQPEDVR